MAVNTVTFLLFFTIIAIVYFLLPQKIQWVWLLIASLYFYMKQSTLIHIGIFLFIILINWFATLFMDESDKRRKTAYTLILIFDILCITIFKYSDFFRNILIQIIGSSEEHHMIDTFVSYANYYAPSGISYFDLILIAYVSDVYWCNILPQKNPLKVILFSSFFPQMTSGPIVKYAEMDNQLWGEKNTFSYERLIRGGERVVWGVFKKAVIAERCAVIVTTIYSSYEVYSGFYIWIAAAMFAMQLYCDFSGLMDIVLGYAEILGIKFPENFKTPFYSLSLSEFWRRWHITLGGFLRDYVLYPLQRSKAFTSLRKVFKKKFGRGYEKKWNLPLHLSLLVSWFLIGLWHGGGWNYIFGVGLYMWAVIVISDLLTPAFNGIIKVLHINTDCESWKLFQRIRTFIFFIFGLSFFRAQTLKDGFQMWKNAFSEFNIWIFFDKSIYDLGLDRTEWGIVILGLILIFIVSFISQKEDVRDFLRRQNYVFRILVFTILFVMIICWGYYGVNFNAADFIYGRF